MVPSLKILVALTILLTFISQMHVKGSQRIRFRWLRGSRRATNEIWTAEQRLRDLREESAVRCTQHSSKMIHSHTHTQERIHRQMCMLKDLFIQQHKKISICTRTHTQQATRVCVEVRVRFISGWGLNLLRQGPRLDTFPQQQSSHPCMCEALRLWLTLGFTTLVRPPCCFYLIFYDARLFFFL